MHVPCARSFLSMHNKACVPLLLSLMCVQGIHADTVWLTNGDQLTGEVLYLDSGKLVFDSSAAGRLRIQWKKVKALETTEALNVEIREFPGKSFVTRLRIADGEQVLMDDGTMSRVSDIVRVVKPRKKRVAAQLEGNLDLSLDMNREPEDANDKIEMRLDTRILDVAWRHGVELDYQYEKEESIETDKSYTGEYNLDYFFRAPWYWRVHTRTERNYYSNNQRDTQYGTGPGYQLRDDEQTSIGVTLDYLRFRYARDVVDEGVLLPYRFRFNALGLGWEFRHEWLGTDIELVGNGNVYHPDDYGIDYVLFSETGLRYHLSGLVNLSMTLEFDQFQQEFVTETSKRYLFGIGVDW